MRGSLVAVVGIPVGATVADIQPFFGKHRDVACPDKYHKIDHSQFLTGDLNEGAHGQFVYLCVKDEVEAGVDRAITDLAIYASSKAQNDCPDDWEQVYRPGSDLNTQAGGKFIYLCRKTDPHGSRQIQRVKLFASDCEEGMSRIQLLGDSDGNFNQGNKGKYITMCFSRCSPDHVQGRWVPRQGQIPAEKTTEQWQYGTKNTDEHTETKTTEWQQSVSATIFKGFKFLSALVPGGVDVSGSHSHTISTTMKTAWTTEYGQTFTAEWGKHQSAMQAWQWEMTTTDVCSFDVEHVAPAWALTAGAWIEPCCLPGFFTTGNNDGLECHSKEAMIQDGEKYGCRVVSDPGTGVQIQSRLSGKCLDLTEGVEVDGTQLQLWDCGGQNPNQRWDWSGKNLIHHHANVQLCVDDPGNAQQDGDILQVWSCNGSPAQQWSLSGGQIKSASGKCMDVTEGSLDNGAKVQLWSCWDANPNQLWAWPSFGTLPSNGSLPSNGTEPSMMLV